MNLIMSWICLISICFLCLQVMIFMCEDTLKVFKNTTFKNKKKRTKAAVSTHAYVYSEKVAK